jgi:hypothetical protein
LRGGWSGDTDPENIRKVCTLPERFRTEPGVFNFGATHLMDCSNSSLGRNRGRLPEVDYDAETDTLIVGRPADNVVTFASLVYNRMIQTLVIHVRE